MNPTTARPSHGLGCPSIGVRSDREAVTRASAGDRHGWLPVQMPLFLDLVVIEDIRDQPEPQGGRRILAALCRVRDAGAVDRDRVWYVLDHVLNDFVVARVTDDPVLRDLGQRMRVMERAHHVPLGKRIPARMRRAGQALASSSGI